MLINFVHQLNVFNNIFPTASFYLPSADVLFMHLKGWASICVGKFH